MSERETLKELIPKLQRKKSESLELAGCQESVEWTGGMEHWNGIGNGLIYAKNLVNKYLDER